MKVSASSARKSLNGQAAMDAANEKVNAPMIKMTTLDKKLSIFANQ
jgi:hypothetical protein